MELTNLENFDALNSNELATIDGGSVTLFSIVIAGVTYKVTAGVAAGFIAGVYGVSYVIGKAVAHYKNR